MDRKSIVQFTHRADNFLEIGNSTYKQWVFRYTFLELEKDLGTKGDVSTDLLFADGKFQITGKIVSRSEGIVAGVSEIKYFLVDSDSNFRPSLKGPFDINFKVNDGDFVKAGDVIMEITADVHDLLAVERVVLNLLMRMSSVATFTGKIVDLVRNSANESSEGSANGSNVLIVPTRKTLWGLLDKKAVLIGGGGTHRISLTDAIILKDTHLDILKRNFDDVFARIEKGENDFRFLEIEVDNQKEVVEVAEKFSELTKNNKLNSIGVVMMDNMSAAEVSEAMQDVQSRACYDDVLFEASGGITGENVLEYARTGVDVISMGCLTRSVPNFDMGMEVVL
ncbi:MAG: carboxylating nicotinate-nucleotide diphosphorylase [Nitrospirae bacterium]|nr:carboxylating nicotinate-nucleotide diphosphorylase [Nitrospirota bacterium]